MQTRRIPADRRNDTAASFLFLGSRFRKQNPSVGASTEQTGVCKATCKDWSAVPQPLILRQGRLGLL